MLWFRKFAAVVSISVGVALVALPFPPSLAGERTAQVLSLEVAPAPFTEATARAELGAVSYTHLTLPTNREV